MLSFSPTRCYLTRLIRYGRRITHFNVNFNRVFLKINFRNNLRFQYIYIYIIYIYRTSDAYGSRNENNIEAN